MSSLVLRFNLLRNNIRTSCPVRFLKQHAGFSSGKLLQPKSYEKRHFATNVFRHDQPATLLVFDVETTGFFHVNNRIVEFALSDLSGGKDCTFQTLINPERDVPKYASKLNNITTKLVYRPDVPRFSDVLPILLAYVRSRQAPSKPFMWIAHNAKGFDVPFLNHEFDRCSAQVPSDWLFVDNLCLARKWKKIDGKKNLVNLEALEKRYGISSEGPSHRAMPDVEALWNILPKITLDFKLTCGDLMNEAMRFSDVRKVS
ncbi:exonuclease DPD1, chloroplastic/mitochondrial-like [Miscanthus floridulus]|uniref:exonuclease DPD1, chloroplastic/mitochondrial-like n=1 Tax=Miscanthus floridulus TaxID=154761 RepID=UPI00345ABE6A